MVDCTNTLLSSQGVFAQASSERDVAAPAAAPAAPQMIDFELIKIAESAEPQLPESLNFDLQIPDMSKVSFLARQTL